MIRCNKCNSTYPKFEDTGTEIDYDKGIITQTFECKCGNEVDLVFKLKTR